MLTPFMHEKLRQIYQVAEKERLKVLQLVQPLSEEEIRHSPRSGKWSISQILSHIIEAERISISYMQKKILGIEAAGNSGIWEETKFLA
ncbi:MAG TPA: DinB family protein, partial [Chryseosolibacter sp.]|nr:DinB family protein [Chryseosolibacter sp.]